MEMCFLTVPETGKSKIKGPRQGSICGESPAPGSQMAILLLCSPVAFPLCVYMDRKLKTERGRESSLCCHFL